MPQFGRGTSRADVFWLQLFYLVVLLGAALAYLTWGSRLPIPNPVGPIPIWVPWFGALGAVAISLAGIFDHAKDWDPAYSYWHWSRPAVGAVMAVVAVLIIQIGILSVGGSKPGPGTSKSLYYVIAFLVAYREETFRELIKRVADIILTPAPPAPKPSVTRLSPSQGPTAGGTAVTITGSGFSSVTAVKFGSQSAQYVVDSDGQITAASPRADQTGSVAVVVTSKSGTASAGQFTYTG